MAQAVVSRVDLHTHTNASDGSLTPEALVRAALAVGLTTIAVTDHDTVSAVAPAQAAAFGTRLRVLAGLELSAAHDGRTLHLLAYGIDVSNLDLTQRLRELARQREIRAQVMLEKLATLGVPVAWEQVVALGRGSIGRPHVARALVAAGHVPDVAAAFQRYLRSGAPAYMPSSNLRVAEAVALVRQAGGTVALAHPLRSGKALELPRLVGDLRALGVSGIEIYHSEHGTQAVAILHQLTLQEGLWWSGGSDFHGATKPQVHLGSVLIPDAVLEQGPFV